MKKILGILGVAVFALTLFLNVSLLIDKDSEHEGAFIRDSYANVKPNYEPRYVRYESGGSFTIGASVSESGSVSVGLGLNWSTSVCCIFINDDGQGCNFAMEDEMCKRVAVRNN